MQMLTEIIIAVECHWSKHITIHLLSVFRPAYMKDPDAKLWKIFFLAVGFGFLTDSINSYFGSFRDAPRSVTWLDS